MTSDFWRYDRLAHELYLPDGTICSYDPTTGRLAEIRDPFTEDNRVTLTWTPNLDGLTVVQHLGTESRTITFEMNGMSLPSTMTYDNRTWHYVYDGATGGELEVISAPGVQVGEAGRWVFNSAAAVYPDRRLRDFTTPNGGKITYDYTQVWLTPTHWELFLTGRTVGDPPVDQPWPWSLTYSWAETYSAQTVVTTPSGRITYAYGPIGVSDPAALIDGAIGLTDVYVDEMQANGTYQNIEHEERAYQQIGVFDQPSGSSFYGPEVQYRTVLRGANSHLTAYVYDSANHGDYHHPKTIIETGELSRTTQFTYAHPQTGVPFIVGLPLTETVTENNQSVVREWSHDSATGFKTRETEFGETSQSAIATTFTKDAYGNRETAKNANDKTTSFTYSMGQLKDITTPLYTIQRAINSDGTVQSETQAGRTTTFHYDDPQGRLTQTDPPGNTNHIVVEYDPDGHWIRTTRGSSVVTTTLDGFGRPIETANSLGVHQRTEYDMEGRVIYGGYPFTSADKGVTIDYDALGRVVRRTNPDGTHGDRLYNGGTVTVTDEEQHATVQTWQAFGDPDDARLATLVDADQKTWHYTYNGLGRLVGVTAPDGSQRAWTYNDKNRLESETHPESGGINYTQYDNAGNLERKTDAKGTLFQYTYDANGRLQTFIAGSHATSVTYEQGSDQLLSSSDGNVTTTFTYDGAGRASRRTFRSGPPTTKAFLFAWDRGQGQVEKGMRPPR